MREDSVWCENTRRRIGRALAFCLVFLSAAGYVRAEVQSDPTYEIPSGWVLSDSEEEDAKTYILEGESEGEETSTITCEMQETTYSVYEYEQLRDKLATDLLYENPTAAITSSSQYTDANDYLYTLIVEEASWDYREIYYYVVGDYQVFLVEVVEYTEDAASAGNQQTPEKAGKKIVMGFEW